KFPEGSIDFDLGPLKTNNHKPEVFSKLNLSLNH
ncbi:MAG: hypothetical protein ACI8ZO_001776, partial [Flavobacteriales bacterium]